MYFLRDKIEQSKRLLRRLYASSWHNLGHARYRLLLWMAGYRSVIVLVFLILLAGISIYSIPTFQSTLEPHFSTDTKLERLRSLLLTLGGALIGTTAIAFSFIMFAMQVNVERMPHGLFRKLSLDRRLLGAFMGTFCLSTAVAALSLIPTKSWLAIATLGAGWGTALVLSLFLYSYRRALSLINPIQQISFLTNNTRKEMEIWARRARRATPLLEPPNTAETESTSRFRSTHDLARVAYFQINSHWINGAQQALLHAISFARRCAERGDHEVSGAALGAIVRIGAAYIAAKGKTFFTNPLLFDNPLSTDSFINDTLEHLRQNIRIGISRGDEQLIEQTLKAFAELFQIYMDIDYSNEHASKTHAHLAARYLSDAVRSVAPHNMADVLMEGVRLMGHAARLFLRYGKPNDIPSLTREIEIIGCVGVANETYRPVTLAAMEQLATLTIDLMRSKSPDIRFAAGELKKTAFLVAKLFLALPSTPLENIHSTYLEPYYSGTSNQALPARFTELANSLMDAEESNEDAKTVIRNIEQWAEDLYQTKKDLLLATIEKKSNFAFDIVHWIAHVTKILLMLSNAPSCEDYVQEKLRHHALWLISVLSWIPKDRDTIAFVEIFRITETLFEAAIDAHNRDCEEVSQQASDLLVSWGFKAGKHQTGWAILERAIYGLATLALARNTSEAITWLTTAISGHLGSEDAPDQEIRDRAAREIRHRAATLYRDGHWSSSIESTMSHVDHGKLKPLLEDVANLLSPETSNDP